MDGFFNRLFPQPQYLSGLLGDEQSMLAQRQAQQQGLLGLAAGLLSAGGQSRQPINIGQAIAQGLSQGQQAYGSALQQQVQGQTLAMQADERRKARQREELVRQIMPTVITPGQTTVEGMTFPVTRDDEGNLLPGVGTGPSSINQQALAVLRSALPPKDFNEVMKAIETEFNIQKAPKREVREVGGRLVDITTGRPQVIYQPPSAPKFSDLGSLYAAVTFPGVDPQNLNPQQLGQVLEFQQRPSPKDLADLQIKAETLKAETGVDLTGNVAALSGKQPIQIAAAAPAVQSVQQPVAQPAPQPVQQVEQVPVAQAETPPVKGEQGFVPTVRNQSIPLKFRNELEVAQPKVVVATRTAIKDLRDLRDAIEQVRNHPGLESATGFGGKTLGAIPGTQAANARVLLDNLKNRNFIAGIVALRQQSPTGSGVGSLTEREGARFENLKATLDEAQTVDQIRNQLDILSRATNEAISGLYQGYQMDYGNNRTIEEDIKRSVINPAGGKRKSLNDIFGK